jgi:hypothetical protein
MPLTGARCSLALAHVSQPAAAQAADNDAAAVLLQRLQLMQVGDAVACELDELQLRQFIMMQIPRVPALADIKVKPPHISSRCAGNRQTCCMLLSAWADEPLQASCWTPLLCRAAVSWQ